MNRLNRSEVVTYQTLPIGNGIHEDWSTSAAHARTVHVSWNRKSYLPRKMFRWLT